MLAHMRKNHQDSTKIQSPLGSFPSSNSATVLQFDEAEGATQGNSSGAVNSPKVVTTGTYLCAVCEINFQNKKEVAEHMNEVHVTVSQQLQDDDDVLDEAGEEQDLNELYDHFEMISKLLTPSDKDEDSTKDIVDKLERFKAILRKKDKIYAETKTKVEELEVENERLTGNNDYNCGECRNINDVETFLHKSLDDKEAEVNEITKKLKKLENEHKKVKDLHKEALDTVHDTLGNVTKRNNDLKIELAKQKSLMTALKEGNRRVDDSEQNESVEDDTEVGVEAHDQAGNQRIIMSKSSNEHKCNACDKVFNAAGDLERHVKDKHTPHECHMCNKKFTTRTQVMQHICTEGDIIEQECEKSYCKKKFVSTNALKAHMKNSHFGNQRSVCKKCGEILNTNMNMTNHMEVCGKQGDGDMQAHEKSKEVCKHWRRGRCHWGSQCNFSHVGRQDIPSSANQSTKSASQACRNGPSCSYLARGKCNFQHHMTQEHQQRGQNQNRVHQSQGRRREDQNSGTRQRAQCKWGRGCTKVPNCPHLHSLQDFPQYDQNQGFRGTNRGSQGRQARF